MVGLDLSASLARSNGRNNRPREGSRRRLLPGLGSWALLLAAAAMPTNASAAWQLMETIPLNGVDILEIGSDGTNIIVLSNTSGGDRVWVFDPAGNPIVTNLQTGSAFTSGITWNGSSAVFARGSTAGSKRLYEMDLEAGSVTGPFTPVLSPTPMGLGFNGSQIAVAPYANGSGGVLTCEIRLFNAVTYADEGMLSVTFDTGTGISGTPTYGVAWHNGDLFLSLQAVDRVFRFDANLDLIEEIPIATEWPRGIAFVGGDLYVADRGAGVLYHYVNCPADLDGSGAVGPSDLAVLLGSWGPNPGHPADLDGDGEVGPSDLAQLLGSWGPCP